jgi:hypothetical protein
MENKEIPMDYHIFVITATVAVPNYGADESHACMVSALDYLDVNPEALLLGFTERKVQVEG